MTAPVNPDYRRYKTAFRTVNVFSCLLSFRKQNLRRRQGPHGREDKKVRLPAFSPKSGSNGSRKERKRFGTRGSVSAMEPCAVRAALQLDEETYALIRRICAVICYIKTLHYNKDYLLDVLRTILKHYTGLKDARSMSHINRQIRSELEKYGGYELSRRELKEIWMV